MHWEVQLTGDTADLQILADSLSTANVEVARSQDGFILRAAAFEELDEARGVRERAIELVTALSGATRLAFGAQTGMSVGAVYRVEADEKRDITVFPDAFEVRIRAMPVTVTVTDADGTSDVYRPTDAVNSWLALSRREVAVAHALRLRDEGSLEWVDLYRLFEVIEADVGAKMYEFRWVTRNECERFRRTANSPSAAGDMARHGRERVDPPPNPMTLPDARELVDRLLRSWLNWKSNPDG